MPVFAEELPPLYGSDMFLHIRQKGRKVVNIRTATSK